ncbi:MAG: T9SS type A sorting domain-containing protein [Chitinophagales bacterium]|nr:T9SS type A sorting domain-containing protein [Chitinophagales bacterium]
MQQRILLFSTFLSLFITFGINAQTNNQTFSSLPSIWRIPYTTALLQFNVVFEFCADGRVTVIQTGPGTLPSCKVCNWWRFGNELLIKSLLSEMTATINESNPAQPFLQNIQLTLNNDILFFYPANTQPNAFLYPVSLTQLAAYKQIGGCPVVPQCPLVNWNTVGTNEPITPTLLLVPNPAQNQVEIQLDDNFPPPLRICLTDVSGRVLLQTSPNTNIIDISGLDAGLYFIRVFWEEGIATKKLIKLRE